MTGCEGVCVLIVSYQGHRAALPKAPTITEPCITSQLWTLGRERAVERVREREKDKNTDIHLIVFPSLAAAFFFSGLVIFPPTQEGQRAPVVVWLYNYSKGVC